MDVQTLIERAGGVSKMAARLNVSHPTVCDWQKRGHVPGNRIVQISTVFGIPVEEVSELIRPVADKNGSV